MYRHVFVVFSSLFVISFLGVGAQNLGQFFHNKRQNGFLDKLGGSLDIPGLDTISKGVEHILGTAKDTVDKLTPPISLGINIQIGKERTQMKPETTEKIYETYPQYELPGRDNASHGNQQINDEIVHIVDGNPVILLKENEIR